MNKQVRGEFPEFCYKAYDNEEHAKQFIYKGIFRLNCRYYCRNMETISRRDPTEGVGLTKEPGIVTVGWVSPNPAEKTIWTKETGHQEHHTEFGGAVFLFCMSLPEVNRDYIKEEFGKYIVKIDDPKKLAEDIYGHLTSDGQRVEIEGCKVVYNKGQKLDRELTDKQRFDLSYRQKEFEKFHNDCEFRIVAFKHGELCESKCSYLSGWYEQKCKFIVVNLGKKSDYLSLVNPK